MAHESNHVRNKYNVVDSIQEFFQTTSMKNWMNLKTILNRLKNKCMRFMQKCFLSNDKYMTMWIMINVKALYLK